MDDRVVHICSPVLHRVRIIRDHCPTCERRRYMIRCDYPWYGPLDTCLWCGERWQDFMRLPRPFKPRWRQENLERAKALFREAAQREAPAP